MSKNQPGQRITLTFEGREFDVIVINPNGQISHQLVLAST
jgi:hypothetical protein